MLTFSSVLIKKAGIAPTPGTTTGQRPARTAVPPEGSTDIAVLPRPKAPVGGPCEGPSLLLAGGCGRRSRPGAVAVDAVVATAGLQAGGERERLACLGVASEHLQRAAEAE